MLIPVPVLVLVVTNFLMIQHELTPPHTVGSSSHRDSSDLTTLVATDARGRQSCPTARSTSSSADDSGVGWMSSTPARSFERYVARESANECVNLI